MMSETRPTSTNRALRARSIGVAALSLALVWIQPREVRSPRAAEQRALIQRQALLTLFTQREHAQQLLLWTDNAHESPALQLLRESGDRRLAFTASTPSIASLALPITAKPVTLAELEAHFREHPDAWEAWFIKFPASSGIVALTEPVMRPPAPNGSARAMIIVARTCGEHCHSAWRLELERTPAGSWQTMLVLPLALRTD